MKGETQYKYNRINCNSERNSVNIVSSHIGHEVSKVGQRQMQMNFFTHKYPKLFVAKSRWTRIHLRGDTFGDSQSSKI